IGCIRLTLKENICLSRGRPVVDPKDLPTPNKKNNKTKKNGIFIIRIFKKSYIKNPNFFCLGIFCIWRR
uniref:hypothetical protein n=1 Tax=Eubacterium sp. TaxID=142586 RepID=UPI003FEEA6A0